MATFNSMPAPGPAEQMGLSAAMAAQGLGIDDFQPDLNFDEAMLESVHGLPPLPFTPSYDFETFSTTFEDPFSYPRPYETAANTEDPNDEESSPSQTDNKLLGFSTTSIKATPLDDSLGTYSELNMSAELYGMFFVAEDVFGGETNTGRPLELTCYRRNLWQCSGQIIMPRHCSQVMNEQGRAVPITEFYASISGIESIEGKTTEIISIPWKNSNPALGEQETKTAGSPPKILLDLSGGQEVDGHRVSLSVAWKRLQFKSATANNGRRKGLQQHYVVQISLLGKMKASGEFMKIADIQSGPVIVRGRSPRNFDSRKDVPLTGEKKGTPTNGERVRTQSDASAAPTPNLKTERTDSSHNLQQYSALNNGTTPQPKLSDRSTPSPLVQAQTISNTQQHPAKRMALSPNLNKPPVPTWSRDNSAKSNLERFSKNASNAASVPISLSLSEDERSPNNRSLSESLTSPRLQRSSASHFGGASPPEEEEELYEYFPLSVDDWTPLVDTVYRPHIVHHIAVPQEIKAQAIRSKSKRYFSAE